MKQETLRFFGVRVVNGWLIGKREDHTGKVEPMEGPLRGLEGFLHQWVEMQGHPVNVTVTITLEEVQE